ncbi:MAG: ATP-dependent RNA helicase DbpA [Rhodocyclaceae bacterium]|nr:ATP-dependent RNA helicase DbpA [Rhodocyclaceae bacterium]
MTNRDFSTLPLSSVFLRNLERLGYRSMTAIQAQSLPLILQQRDLIAQANTGSGKTLAFAIGILHRLDPADFSTQALVLCPTRELADQVAKELRRVARFADNIKVLTLCGGVPMGPQIASLKHGAHVIVGTPGRIQDHMSRASIDLSGVRTLVLDEGDRMVGMGFFDEIKGIVNACPRERQTLLFSATYPDDMKMASAAFLNRPLELKVDAAQDAPRVEQRFYEVAHERRNLAVLQLLAHFRPESTLAFCNTRIHCRELAAELRAQGISALALHGELEQRERDELLVQFANRSCTVLVATDVAARGLDIRTVDAVINVDVAKDTEVHTHRIGRTGRLGSGDKTGLALSLCAPSERKWVKLIEAWQGGPVRWFALAELQPATTEMLQAPMLTLRILGGRKDKLRPGDLLGALTGITGLNKDQVGRIDVFDDICFVALERQIAARALASLIQTGIKGRNFRMNLLKTA